MNKRRKYLVNATVSNKDNQAALVQLHAVFYHGFYTLVYFLFHLLLNKLLIPIN